MRRPEFIARQSRRPSGVLGWLIGRIMEGETAAENDATLAALSLRRGDRVLEIGFGPGRAVEKAAAAIGPEGKVFGIDTSQEMLRVASKRCRELIGHDVVDLRLASVEQLPFADEVLDKAFSVHTIYFWEDPRRSLLEIRRVLRSGGKLALCFRRSGPTASDTFPSSVYRFYSDDEVVELLTSTGFVEATVRDVAPDGVLAIATASAER